MTATNARTKPIYRLLLLGATMAVVIPIMRGMSTGALPAGPVRTLLLLTLASATLLGIASFRQHLSKQAAARRVKEFLVFFDDMSLLRPRSQAARALLAGEPANDMERRSIVAVTQCLGEMACAVADGGPEGRSEVLAHPIVGAWLRALAVTPITLSFTEEQRTALKSLFVDVGASSNRREPLDDGSRALLERDAVLFRGEEAAARIF
jgi:hypothetical protein